MLFLNKSCKTLYGILIPPYLYLLISAVMFVIFKVCMLEVVFPWMKRTYVTCCSRNANHGNQTTVKRIEEVESNMHGKDVELAETGTGTVQHNEPSTASADEAMKRKTAQLQEQLEFSKWFDWLQACNIWFSFIYFVSTAPSSLTGWKYYTYLNGFIINSAGGSAIALLCGLMRYNSDYYLDELLILYKNHRIENDLICYYNNVAHEAYLAECGAAEGKEVELPRIRPVSDDALPCTVESFDCKSVSAADKYEVKLSNGTVVKDVAAVFFHPFTPTAQRFRNLIDSTGQNAMELSVNAMLPFVAGLVTHVLPAIVMYFWVIMIVVIALGLCVVPLYYVMDKVFEDFIAPQYDDLSAAGKRRGIFRHFAVLCMYFYFLFCFQSLYNYAVLFYDHHGYLGAIATEFALRSQTQCYLDNFLDSAKQGLVNFGWV